MRTISLVLVSLCLGSPALADPVGEVSKWRRANGLPGVAYDAVLEEEAMRHARAIAGAGRMEHGRFAQRMRGIGRQAGAVENLAAGMEDFDVALARWVRSPPHLANLVRGDLGKAGVGSAIGVRGRRYWVIILAR